MRREDIILSNHRKLSFLVRDKSQENRQPVIGLRYVLAAHNAEIIDILAVAEDTYPAIAAFRGIAAHAIDALFVGVTNAGDIQKMLAFQLRVEGFAQEEAQGIFGALDGRVAIAEIELVA